jgi:hypothetical protein
LLAFVPAVVAGCTIYLGPYDDDTGGTANQSGEVISPEEAQQARDAEAWSYTANVIYKGGEILYSYELPSGDIVDFINRDTLPAVYELPALPIALELPPGVELGLTEIEQIPEILDLALIATPFVRPTFWPYILGETDATSIEDYLARYQMPGQLPQVPADRLYAGLHSIKPNRGISGYVNQFRSEVETDSFSQIEFAVACPLEGPVQEQIGVVLSVDKANFFGKNPKQLNKLKDGQLRLHIEYLRPDSTGQVAGMWDNIDGQFVDNPIRLHHPGEIVPASVLDETMVEHLLAIFQAPVTGDWWIAYNGDLLGYYPATLFTMLNGGACRSAWYGEVAKITQASAKNPTWTPGWNMTMGSGEFAEAGLLNAAHVRDPRYYDLTWAGVPATEDPPFSLAAKPNKPQCYTRSELTHIPAPWDSSFMFLGGPGGKNPGCTWP